MKALANGLDIGPNFWKRFNFHAHRVRNLAVGYDVYVTLSGVASDSDERHYAMIAPDVLAAVKGSSIFPSLRSLDWRQTQQDSLPPTVISSMCVQTLQSLYVGEQKNIQTALQASLEAAPGLRSLHVWFADASDRHGNYRELLDRLSALRHVV